MLSLYVLSNSNLVYGHKFSPGSVPCKLLPKQRFNISLSVFELSCFEGGIHEEIFVLVMFSLCRFSDTHIFNCYILNRSCGVECCLLIHVRNIWAIFPHLFQVS